MGRKNYIATFYLQVRYTNKTLAEDNDYQKVIEQCFVYAKDEKKAKPNKQIEAFICFFLICGHVSTNGHSI